MMYHTSHYSFVALYPWFDSFSRRYIGSQNWIHPLPQSTPYSLSKDHRQFRQDFSTIRGCARIWFQQVEVNKIIYMKYSSTSNFQDEENIEIEARRDKRARIQKKFGLDYYIYNVEKSPLTLKDVLSSPNVIFFFFFFQKKKLLIMK